MLCIASSVLFGSKASGDKSFVCTPLNDCLNIHSYIKRHEVLSFHTASQQIAIRFLDVTCKFKTPKTESINSILSSRQRDHSDIVRSGHIVKEIIDVLILCDRQNIAIRVGAYRRQM